MGGIPFSVPASVRQYLLEQIALPLAIGRRDYFSDTSLEGDFDLSIVVRCNAS